jgi:hypothetical protein
MLRRRLFWPVRRPILRGAIVGGVGYLIGRRSAGRGADDAETQTVSGRLGELEALRRGGKVSDAEYEEKRSEILKDL